MSSDTTTISVRLENAWFHKLKQKAGTTTLSDYIRKLIFENLKQELTRKEVIEFQLEELKLEMKRWHDYQKTLLKHGSYAQKYLEKIHDQQTVTHPPFSQHRGSIIKPEEFHDLDRIILKREELNKEFHKLLKELLDMEGVKENGERETG
jgi:serine/threonine protein kinase HipA of HipAB toxin-antitoxin module